MEPHDLLIDLRHKLDAAKSTVELLRPHFEGSEERGRILVDRDREAHEQLKKNMIEAKSLVRELERAIDELLS